MEPPTMPAGDATAEAHDQQAAPMISEQNLKEKLDKLKTTFPRRHKASYYRMAGLPVKCEGGCLRDLEEKDVVKLLKDHMCHKRMFERTIFCYECLAAKVVTCLGNNVEDSGRARLGCPSCDATIIYPNSIPKRTMDLLRDPTSTEDLVGYMRTAELKVGEFEKMDSLFKKRSHRTISGREGKATYQCKCGHLVDWALPHPKGRHNLRNAHPSSCGNPDCTLGIILKSYDGLDLPADPNKKQANCPGCFYLCDVGQGCNFTTCPNCCYWFCRECYNFKEIHKTCKHEQEGGMPTDQIHEGYDKGYFQKTSNLLNAVRKFSSGTDDCDNDQLLGKLNSVFVSEQEETRYLEIGRNVKVCEALDIAYNPRGGLKRPEDKSYINGLYKLFILSLQASAHVNALANALDVPNDNDTIRYLVEHFLGVAHKYSNLRDSLPEADVEDKVAWKYALRGKPKQLGTKEAKFVFKGVPTVTIRPPQPADRQSINYKNYKSGIEECHILAGGHGGSKHTDNIIPLGYDFNGRILHHGDHFMAFFAGESRLKKASDASPDFIGKPYQELLKEGRDAFLQAAADYHGKTLHQVREEWDAIISEKTPEYLENVHLIDCPNSHRHVYISGESILFFETYLNEVARFILQYLAGTNDYDDGNTGMLALLNMKALFPNCNVVSSKKRKDGPDTTGGSSSKIARTEEMPKQLSNECTTLAAFPSSANAPTVEDVKGKGAASPPPLGRPVIPLRGRKNTPSPSRSPSSEEEEDRKRRMYILDHMWAEEMSKLEKEVADFKESIAKILREMKAIISKLD